MISRRHFATTLAAAAPVLGQSAGRLPIKKAVWFGMLPKTLSLEERCKLAKDVGFEEM
ncbi:MAG: hypothetical protein JNN08_07805, partial [Bryobacterales bacterium]|nr:hypothetical protein [Bryobacterales bacterium]